MDVASGADRVRVHEPLPGLPSGADPLSAEYIRRLTTLTVFRLVLSAILVAFGVLNAVIGDAGSVLSVLYLVAAGSSLALWSYVLSVYRRLRPLLGQPYHRLDVAPDGLLVKGARVSVRLPDGRWLRTRLPDGPRVQLAGERRLWILGTDRRVFVRLPGAMWLRAGRIEDAPQPGATPAEQVSRRPTPPRHDPVLAAHQAYQARRALRSGVVFLVVGGACFLLVSWTARVEPGVVTAATVGGVAGGSGVSAMLGLLMVVGALRVRRPITEDTWVELRVALDAPFVPGSRSLARLSGWALHPDGRQTRFRLTADISLAANVATTGQLWLRGYPRPGKPAKAGVPGYPCGGSFRGA